VPSFSSVNLNGAGSVTVSAAVHGTPTVLLFFGNWCPSCHQELPPLAAAVRSQRSTGGTLSRIRVIGVDSEDKVGSAKSFIRSSGVTFPVAYDPNLTILSGDFYFEGDPNAVFINGNGKINKIVNGDQLTPATFTADERALTPSGS
jgi:peroxiredoxin